MTARSYYSVRTGRLTPDSKIELELLRRLFVATYTTFEERGRFQERLGINCVDGYIPGTAGPVDLYAFRKLRRDNLFPIWARRDDLSEAEIFDLIEFLYDHASEPTHDGLYHDWNQCGYHYSEFAKGNAAKEFRDEVNEYLRDYGEGYELSEYGEVLTLPSVPLQPLLQAAVPSSEPDNVSARVEAAVRKFRLRSASEDDRRDAIRDLADVLEYLRPRLRKVLVTADEQDLFNIANNFGIRHHNERQRSHYDKRIWYSWIFYFYLATIHAAVRLIEQQE